MAQQAPAEVAAPSGTITVEPPAAAEDVEPTLRLHLHRPPNSRHVAWQKDTIDNEHMGKKKSKCCCVYRKPHDFGESSSDEEDDCSHCIGHRKPKSPPGHPPPAASNETGTSQ